MSETTLGASNMLELALKASVPIITCTTTDTVNAAEIIQHLAGVQILEVMDFEVDSLSEIEERVIVTNPQSEMTGTFEELYATLVEAEKTLVFVNTDYESSLFMACGVIPIPDEMARTLIEQAVDDDMVDGVLQALGGMDLKTIGEVIRITATRDNEITIKGILNTRKMVAPNINGLTQLSTVLPFYIPKAEISDWVEQNKPYFIKDVDPRLRPRGLMFSGREGCGKTQGAKYVAECFEVPLYLLNLADLMTRWYGEAETNLRTALQTLDNEEPCVVLIDEVEKIFSTGVEDTTSRLLAQLLWWMQERESRVLIILTCNHIEKLPKELYREQRIDRTVDFQGISDFDEAVEFMRLLSGTFENLKVPTVAQIKKHLKGVWDADTGATHSRLTQTLTDLIKELNGD